MSVRRRSRRNPKTGKVAKVWMVDVDYRHPDGRRQRVRDVSPVQTRRGAVQHECDVRAQIQAGTYGREEVRREIPTLEAFSREFQDTYVKTNNKPSERRAKELAFKNHLVPHLGRLRVDQVGVREIEQTKAKLIDRLAPKSVNNVLAVLSTTLRHAEECKLIAPGARPKIRFLKIPKQRFDYLTFAEAERLLDAAATEPEWWTMILVALRTGLRSGELRGLQWADLDLRAGRLMVRRTEWEGQLGPPKNGKEREVPLSPETVAALRRHRHLRSEFVFCRPDGALLTDDDCKWPLWRACRKAGILRVDRKDPTRPMRPIGWHVARHSFASHLVMRGVSLKAVQELLGHEDMKTTMRYAHLAPEVRRDAVAVLDLKAPAVEAEPDPTASRHHSGTTTAEPPKTAKNSAKK